MTRWQRTKLISLVNSMVDKLGVSSAGNRFAIGTFGPSSTIYNSFQNSHFHNAKNVKAIVKKKFEFVPKAWGTRTDIALNIAASKLFGSSSGGDRSNAKNVLLVITDGKPFKAKGDKKIVNSIVKIHENIGGTSILTFILRKKYSRKVLMHGTYFRVVKDYPIYVCKAVSKFSEM